MESERKVDTPKSDHGVWSPDILYGNHPHCSGTGMTSTPYFPLTFRTLNESEDSSKQDSGYCSATPRSADSGELFGKCRHCHKFRYHSHMQSTPEYACCCKKHHTDDSSPNMECMEVIQEVKMSPTPKMPSRIRPNMSVELYEDAMDTSLYPEEMQVDHNFSSGENHHCSLDFSELAEENSIDFVEPHISSVSQSSTKEIPPTNLCLNNFQNHDSFESSDSTVSEKKDLKLLKTDTGTFFNHEIFNCDLVSPKIKNELTPTKLKRGTPPAKAKKSSSFQCSAKKVATMNRVIRSFFPLNGLESVDILYQLGVKRNFHHIVSRIFNFLSERDLNAVRVVSKTWNKLLSNDYAAYNRWQLHFTALKLMKENFRSPVKQGGSAERRPALSGMQLITNLRSPPRPSASPQQPFSPPVSPGSARFRSYQRAARSLKKDERLLPCPKCRFPSTDHGSPVVQCPRSGCRHRFCVWCNTEVLPNLPHNCPPLYTPRCLVRKNNVHSIGSKVSKRNLRRL